MPFYQLTLFYPTVRQHVATLTRIRSDVESMAGSNWRVLSAGEHVCAIGFETELPPSQIQARLGSFDGIEQFEFLLVEVAKIHGGVLGTGVWQWISSREVAKK